MTPTPSGCQRQKTISGRAEPCEVMLLTEVRGGTVFFLEDMELEPNLCKAMRNPDAGASTSWVVLAFGWESRTANATTYI